MIPLNRHGPGILLRKLKRWLEPDLDPGRAVKVFDEFDRLRGFDAWQKHCQSCLGRALSPAASHEPVAEQGFVKLQAMSAARARELLGAVSRDQEVARLKLDSAKLEGYELDNPALVRELLEAALGEEVDRHCLGYFRSEYMVYWYTLSRTAPSNEPASVSFRWHCDKGPRAHLKLLVYLNDYSEHGGGTSYLNLVDSAAVARTGYMFARGRRRADSLQQLVDLSGTALHAYDHHPQAGDAVLFQPARVLHSGITPSRGPRYVLALCLLPSPVPWREALARGAHIDLRTDPIWHAKAADIAKRLAGTSG